MYGIYFFHYFKEIIVKKSTPFNKKEVKNDAKASKNTEKSVKPVAKDTNKTRRKDTMLPLKNAIKKKTKP